MNDIELIRKALNDKNMFSLIMEKYHNEIFSYVYNMTGNVQDTEDLLQEIFLKIYNNLSSFNRDKASFRTWIYRIATNHVYNFAKKAESIYVNHSIEVNTELLTDSTDLFSNIIKDDQLDLIIQTIKKVLKPKHQKILYLHFFSGLTPKEISNVLKIPDKTIYKALKTSIEKIKKEVLQDG